MVFIPRWSKFRENKPVGDVEIDWNNPISNNLAFATIATSLFDLVTNKSITIAGNKTSLSSTNEFVFSDKSDEANNGLIIGTSSEFDYTTTSKFSFISRVKPVNVFAVDFRSIFSKRDGDASYQYQLRLGNGTISLLTTGGSLNGGNIPLGEYSNIAVTYGDNTSIYTNKTKSTAASKSITSKPARPIIGSVDFAPITNFALGGNIEYFYIFNDNNDDKVYELFEAPYQILKARRRYWIASSGAVIHYLTGALTVGNSNFSGNAKRVLSALSSFSSSNSSISGSIEKTVKLTGHVSSNTSSNDGNAIKSVKSSSSIASSSLSNDGTAIIEGISSATGGIINLSSSSTGNAERNVKSNSVMLSGQSTIDGTVTIIGILSSSGNVNSGSAFVDSIAKKSVTSASEQGSQQADVGGFLYKHVSSNGALSYSVDVVINGVFTSIAISLDQIEWVLAEHGLNLVMIEHESNTIICESVSSNLISG
jgi:hypothetical protein